MHVLESSAVVFLDVGANIGWHSIYAAAVGYTVLAFEPMLKNIGAMRRTLCQNPELQQRLTLISTVSAESGVLWRGQPACMLALACSRFDCVCRAFCRPSTWGQGLSHKASTCKFLVKTINHGNGVAVCGAAQVKQWLSPEGGYEEAGEFELSTLDLLFEGSMEALTGRVAAAKVDVEVRPSAGPCVAAAARCSGALLGCCCFGSICISC